MTEEKFTKQKKKKFFLFFFAREPKKETHPFCKENQKKFTKRKREDEKFFFWFFFFFFFFALKTERCLISPMWRRNSVCPTLCPLITWIILLDCWKVQRKILWVKVGRFCFVVCTRVYVLHVCMCMLLCVCVCRSLAVCLLLWCVNVCVFVVPNQSLLSHFLPGLKKREFYKLR